MRNNGIFSPVSDGEVTRAILHGFYTELEEYITHDATVVGAGPAGLTCARELARQGFRVLLVERNNYLGGGFWVGGFLMNKLTVRAPAQKELEEIGVDVQEVSPGLHVTDAPWACSRLIASACEAGVKVLNLASVEDLIVREGRVCGTVVNWSPVGSLPRQITCVDPVSFESKVVVDATGHDAAVADRLATRGLIHMNGMGPMDAARSEDAIVDQTSEVYPGLIVAGMSVSTVCGLPRMGPTFGGMLLSGRRAAEIASGIISRARTGGRKSEPATV